MQFAPDSGNQFKATSPINTAMDLCIRKDSINNMENIAVLFICSFYRMPVQESCITGLSSSARIECSTIQKNVSFPVLFFRLDYRCVKLCHVQIFMLLLSPKTGEDEVMREE